MIEIPLRPQDGDYRVRKMGAEYRVEIAEVYAFPDEDDDIPECDWFSVAAFPTLEEAKEYITDLITPAIMAYVRPPSTGEEA